MIDLKSQKTVKTGKSGSSHNGQRTTVKQKQKQPNPYNKRNTTVNNRKAGAYKHDESY